MYNEIVVGTDGSELSQKAVDHACRLAKSLGSRLTAVIVTEPWSSMVAGEVAISFPVDEYKKSAARRAANVLASVADTASRAGVVCAGLHVEDQHPAEGILQAAASKKADLIVMGSHGRRGLSRMFLGSEANKVVAMSTVPVLVIR